MPGHSPGATNRPLLGRNIGPYEPLMTRVDAEAVQNMIEASKPAATTLSPESATPGGAAQPAAAPEHADSQIDLDQFLKIDLRIATVVAAEAVEGADKLLRLTVDIGPERRTVLAGIRAAYQPADLVGKQVVLVANLKPRKMRFGVSEGMLLAASGDEPGVFLISPDAGAKPGMRVR